MDSVVAELVSILRHQRLVVDYMLVSAVAALIYDYLLTLRLEVKLIWFSRWSYTKILFLALRYMPFVGIFLAVHNQIFLNISAKICKVTYPMEVWFSLVQMILAEVILAIRTWAVWNRNQFVGFGLAALLITYLVLQCIFGNNFIHSMQYGSPPYLGFRGCFLTSADRTVVVNVISGTIVATFILALMAISAFRTYRQGNSGQFSRLVHRDGILFYIYILCISVANVAVVFSLSLDMMYMLNPFLYMLYSILTARIVLNIRRDGNRDVQTELHTGHTSSGNQLTLPLQFARPEGCSVQSQSFPEPGGGDDNTTHTLP